MKDGDKIYCIKSISEKKYTFFIKNKTYKIKKIDYKSQMITLSNEFNYDWCFNIYNQQYDVYKFNDYFVTLKQYRKLKLKKLNETR